MPQAQIGGSLEVAGKPGVLCPLKATKVRGTVYGPAARVALEQTFVNTTASKMEAIYTFPLPENAAVDRMVFRIGDRVIEGEIKRREDARKIYENARANNQAAALLDQNRPNLFVQSVANIPAGATVKVEISYVNMLRFEDGQFEINFPLVVAPRFNRADHAPVQNPSYSLIPLDTSLDIAFNINAGTPISKLSSETHQLSTNVRGESGYFQLKNPKEIPNRDLVVRYTVAGEAIKPAMVTSWDAQRGGHFCFMLLPPKAPKANQISPRDMMFVMDQSGSQSGFAIEKSKELTLKMLDRLRPGDTFNVFGFNTEIKRLFPISVPPTEENLAAARAFVRNMNANGGTFVREGVVAALHDAPIGNRLKVVLFNTDGLVGNEQDVLAAIVENRKTARMFNFGIGNSVNRALLEAMTVEGRGDVEYVNSQSNVDQAVARFVSRTETPTLVNVGASFSGDVEINSTSPALLPDLFGQRPIIIFGKYKKAGPVQVRVTGDVAGKPWAQDYMFELSQGNGDAAVPTLWARSAVDDLTRKQYMAQVMSKEINTKAIEESITNLGLSYRIMTEYTSFVAVDKVCQADGRMITVPVPVNAPAGMDMLKDQSSGPLLQKAGLPRGSAVGGYGGGGLGGAMPATKAVGTPGTVAAEAAPERKMDDKLEKATGLVKLRLTVTDLSEGFQKRLRDLGVKNLKVIAADKAIECEADASLLAKLDLMIEITKIRKR